MPGLSAFAPRGLMPVAKVRAGHNWADAATAKKLTRDKLMMWLMRSAITVANHAREEAPMSDGAGRSWINATVDDTEPAAYAGIIGPMTGTKGGPAHYMGYIEKGITPHFTNAPSLKRWYKRTLGAAARLKPTTFGEITAKFKAKDTLKALKAVEFSGLFVWKDLASHGGPKRERMAGGRIGIPWLSRGIKRSLPEIRADLQAIARTS
jgi:hypothetical protein